ncbi:cytochrome c oxidase subunit II [Ferroacidibacillus organovorans]|uniref:cytochrome c oxidase subunit II n=1 Tax=Ferroacidibacillus organovorans TaxID=1765683 RepID=UPI0009EA90D7|nr:cytochrome c oxidase subunit II [Ferroacidibacillus organovorans]
MIDILLFAVFWLIATLLGEWGVHAMEARGLYYSAATSQALDGEKAMAFILTVLVPVIAFIVVMLIYTALRFRSRRSLQFRDNKMFIGIWVLLSIALNILFFVHPSASALEQMFNNEEARLNRHDLIVNVTARQWEWIFSYPQYGIQTAEDSNGNSTLYLPVNQNVRFVLRSYDPYHTYDPNGAVIHDFWIPAFGLKQDIIPGETRLEYVHTNKITSYDVDPMVRVQCAEVCGPGHPFMEAPVHVVSSSDFLKWVQAQRKLEAS